MLLLLWWVLPAGVKSFMRVGFHEFQAPAWTTSSYIADLQDYWAARNHSKHDLVEAGQALARRGAAYELKVQENKSLRREIARLEALLVLPAHAEYQYEVARVVRREMSAWWQLMTIRKGRMHGVRAGQAVVYRGGVVGRVSKVYTYTAEVELCSSPAFRMAAHFEEDERPVTYQGGQNVPLTRPRGRVLNAQPDIKASAQEPVRLVSSRLGGVFPDGLTIGLVEALVPSPDGLFQSGEVLLNTDLMSLKEVAVLVPVSAEDDGEAE